MQAIWHDRLPIADIVNAQVISLEEAPKGYADFDKGGRSQIRARSPRHCGKGGLKLNGVLPPSP